MMTLALLLTAATSAWAESKPIGLNVEYAAGDVITTTSDVYVYYGEQSGTLRKMGAKITSTDQVRISMIGLHSFEVDGGPEVYFLDNGESTGGVAGGIPCIGESTGDATVVHVASGSGTLADPYVFGSGPFGNAFPISWSATSPNTASIAAMPAGNVTVNVKYFAQAEFAKSTDATLAPAAIAGVPANTDAPIVTAGTVANIGTSEVKQGTLMYYVSQSTGNTAPDAPTYDIDGWTDKVPTANGLAQGDAYVWYYIKGAEPAQGTARTDDNTRSDSDIKPLGTTGFVTLLPEPTYTVSLNKTDLAEGEPALWKAKSTNVDEVILGTKDLEGVKKSETVTVTYSGTKKIIGVKAEKKAAAVGHELSASAVGEIVGSDGKAYAEADKDNLPTGVTAVAKICYVGRETGEDAPYNHGLALALSDADDGNTCKWKTGNDDAGHTKQTGSNNFASESGLQYNATHNSDTYPAFKAAIANNGTAAPTGCSAWFLASGYQWNQMIAAAGISNLGLLEGDFFYWSSTEYSDTDAWNAYSPGGWFNSSKNFFLQVRACLAF